jgi:hypothetical protein
MSNQRRVILQFFYAVCDLKSICPADGMRCELSIRLLAVTALCLSSFLAAQTPLPLAIVDQNLPAFNAGIGTQIALHASGGVPPYRWSASAGDLPEGVVLTSDGFLIGRPTQPGAFVITITVEDSGRPAHSFNKTFRASVTAALLLDWLRLPLIHNNRIDGAVQVSNGSRYDFEATVIIVAVNSLGRATALGYQHFNLRAGAPNVKIPFDESLPPGSYVIHADAVAEIPANNSILRQRLQTSSPLPVTSGP